jgi:uncharacterized membrane protein (DUF485 family)
MLRHGSRRMSDDNKIGTRNDYAAIAASKPFRHLLTVKKNFIVPAFVIFLIYYFALAVLVGYAPRFASIRVIGAITVAYLFALSQFVVGWIIAALYLVAASKFDALTDDILAREKEDSGRH